MTALLTRDDTMPATLTPTAPLDAPAFRPAQPSRTNGHLTPASNPLAFNSAGYPAFFDQAPTLTVQDGLARFLGATRDGILTYRYLDAVRLAGHSCPTVAGSWLMVIRGLKALYGDDIPERGNIDVLMRDERHEGTTGVIASVATLELVADVRVDECVFELDLPPGYARSTANKPWEDGSLLIGSLDLSLVSPGPLIHVEASPRYRYKGQTLSFSGFADALASSVQMGFAVESSKVSGVGVAAALRAPHGGPEMLGWAADTVARALSACGHTGGVQIRVW